MLKDIYLYDNNKNKIVKMKPDNVLDKLYNLNVKVPTLDEIKDNDLFKLFKNKTAQEILNKIKKNISKIEEKVPLYDPVSENIYLINKNNVYDRIVFQDYRFPEKDLIKEFEDKKNKLTSEKSEDEIIQRKIRKLKLNIMFMNYFDIDTLYKTYIKVFYETAKLTGDITVCKKRSFIPRFTYMKPFYTKKEIISLAVNEHILKNYKLDISKQELMKICKLIKENEISADQLLKHQKYIISSGRVGLVQYYTIHGSEPINLYLRGFTNYNCRNEFLENIISSMWELVINAPEFKKPYIFYRFIKEDSFISDLKIGDIFTEKGFLSTTRDPFYKLGDDEEEYTFGDILMKINIPTNKKGVALCLETISHFPNEQEVIFPPNSQFKLIKKDNNCLYSHPDKEKSEQIKTKYEFKWVGNSKDIKFEKKPDCVVQYPEINFLNSIKSNSSNIDSKINYFLDTYVNEMNQIKLKINNVSFTAIAEVIDTSHAYKDFFAMKIENNLCIYVMYNNYVLFFIEIGSVDGIEQIHVNYHVKYSELNTEEIISDNDYIGFISSLAYYFEINNVVIYANYKTCDIIQEGEITESTIRKNIYGGTYCVDINKYIESGHKRYEELKLLEIELTPKFSYEDIDNLKNISPKKILVKTDPDEIYQIYDKEYNKFNDNIIDFYLWLLKNYCYLVRNFINKIDRVIMNPFNNDYYILDPSAYLYNRNFINSFPKFTYSNIKIKRNLIKTNDRRIIKELR